MTTQPYPEASQATSALIWSIVALVCCQPAGIVGYIQARNELEAIQGERRDPANEGTAQAAKIIGLIALVLGVLAIVAGIAFLVLFMLGTSIAFTEEFGNV